MGIELNVRHNWGVGIRLRKQKEFWRFRIGFQAYFWFFFSDWSEFFQHSVAVWRPTWTPFGLCCEYTWIDLFALLFFGTLFCHEQWGENLGVWPVPCEVNSVLFYLVKRGEAPQVVAFTSEEMKIRDFVKEMFEGHGAAQDIPTSFWILYIYTFTTRTGDLNGIFTQLERLKCGSFRQHFWRRFFFALDEDDDRAWMRISRRHWSQTRTTLRTCSHSAL